MSGAACDVDYFDPFLFSSLEEFAQARASMEQELGMPSQPHRGRVGRRVNELHFERQAAMNDDLGWHGTTPAQLRAHWGLS